MYEREKTKENLSIDINLFHFIYIVSIFFGGGVNNHIISVITPIEITSAIINLLFILTSDFD